MTLEELKKRLDEIAWHEQVEMELRERVAHPLRSEIDERLRALASETDAAMLDALEREPGYLVWTLRLAPLVEQDRARDRALRYVNSEDWHVRQWAQRAIS